MKITGAQGVVKALEKEDVHVVFGYPGGAILPVYDQLMESGIKHVLVRNEQAAAHAASGYARATGKVGVCIVTSGPGATNLITGIATAYMDSVPIVAITGQVPKDMIGRDVFQEIDITGATEPFTKHNYLVKDAKELPRIIKEAFHIASTGRPGPVLIDIPKDVQQESIHFNYSKEIELKGYKPTYKGHPKQLKKLIEALKKSNRPVIVVGGGGIASDASSVIVEFADRINAPVATTLMGIGSFPSSHPLCLGMLGGDHGVYPAKMAIAEADFLIVLGARMADRSTGKREDFALGAKVAHIDIDPAEIGKNINIDIPIVGDIKNTLKELLKFDFHRKDTGWLDSVGKWKKVVHGVGEGLEKLNPMEIIQGLSTLTDDDTIIVTDVGQHQMWTGRYYKVENPRTFLTSGGLGTMGYGLPAAIGARIARPESQVILITGDGSFQMNMPELATMVQEGLNIKVIVLNNSCLGMVRELQQHFYEERYYQVKMTGNPDFVQIAKAYGIESMRVESQADILPSIEKILNWDGAFLGEFIIDPGANVIPPARGC